MCNTIQIDIQSGKKGKSRKSTNGKELLAAPFTHNCNNRVNNCQSVRRLIMILDWYKTMRSIHSEYEMEKLLIEYVDHYTNLLNDYQHILSKHLNEDRLTNDDNFLSIHNKISKYMDCPCDVKTCKQYIRMVINVQGKSRANTIEDTNTDTKDNNSIDKMEEHDNKNTVNFYIELLDVIHCYFMHSFDLGLRIPFEEEEIIDFTEEMTSNDDEMVYVAEELIIIDEMEKKDQEFISFSDQHHHELSTTTNTTNQHRSKPKIFHDDEELKRLENILSGKRDTFKTLRGLNLTQHSKFVAGLSLYIFFVILMFVVVSSNQYAKTMYNHSVYKLTKIMLKKKIYQSRELGMMKRRKL